MSNHLIDCARLVHDLPPVAKLLLLCLANDSRDGSGRIASPGLAEAMTWTDRGRSQTLEAFTLLVDRGLIQQHQRGQKGRTAEWLLFPTTGCCDVHSRLDRQDLLPAVSTGSESSVPNVASGSGNDSFRVRTVRTPPQVLLPRTTTTPLPPKRRAAPPQRAAEDELAAELRTLRREHDLPGGRWTRQAIAAAIARAVAAGFDQALVADALRAVAIDPATELPGRVAVAGPWWDATEADELLKRRAARADARGAMQATRAACSCDYGWIDGHDGKPSKCPTCHPQIARSHA